MAWTQLFDQTNWGANTTPSAVAGSTTNVPGWIDKAGNWSVDTTRIKSPAGGSFTEFLYRPESAKTNARIIGRLEADGGYRSLWLRLNPTGNSAYYCIFDTAQGLTVSKLVSGTNSPIFSIDAATWGYNAAKAYEVDFSVTGTSPTTIALIIKNITDNVTTYTLPATTDSEASLQTSGRYGLSFYGGPSYYSRIAAFHDDVIPSATTYTLSGSVGSVASGDTVTYTVALPNNTTVASPVTITFSDNGGGGSFSPATVQLSDTTTSTTTTYTANTSGTKSISSTNNGGLTNPSAQSLTVTSASDQLLLPSDAKLVRSPYNWTTRNTYLETNNAGAYLKIKFTGASLSAILDVSHLVAASVPAGAYPTIKWSIDNKAILTYQLTSADGSYPLATGLTAGTHTCQLWVDNFNLNLDRWSTPVNAVRIQRFEVGSGQSFLQADSLFQRAIFFGDSITEGVAVGANNTAVGSYSASLANSLGVEYGQIGFGFLGWTVATPSPSNVPAFTTSWNLQMSGVNRSFSPAPDMVFVNMGTNDGLQSVGSSTVQSAIASWLTAARTALGSACKIFLIVPFGQFQSTAVNNAFNAYKTANPSDLIYLIDLGADGSTGLTNAGASVNSDDGIHPNVLGTLRLAGLMSKAVQSKLGGGGSPPSTTTNLSQGIQRYGTHIGATPLTLSGSAFAVGSTTVFNLNSTGNLLSWQNGRASFLNTMTAIPAYTAFQILPGAAITSPDSLFSFGSAFTS